MRYFLSGTLENIKRIKTRKARLETKPNVRLVRDFEANRCAA